MQGCCVVSASLDNLCEFYEIPVSLKLTNLVYWEIEESHDAFMNTVQDTRTYWLNITDEIAMN
ncbi:MAG: hypothetical protein ACPGLV_04020 [Bacteroidia bacterium]